MKRVMAALALSAVVGPAWAAESPAAEGERNKAIILEFETEVYAKRNVEAMVNYIAPDFVEHSPTVPVPTREGLLDDLRQRRAALHAHEPPNQPPVPLPPTVVLADGDMVMRAREAYLDDPKEPGKKYTAFVYDLYRLRDGKIVEHWTSARR